MESNQKILYDCKKATLLLEKELETRLSIRESFELKLHLTSCSICRLYQTQTALISTMVKQILNREDIRQLDNQFKTGLQDKINNRYQQNKNTKGR